jgi:multidrug resistance efflux pump
VSAGSLIADYQIQNLERDLESARLSLETAIIRLQSGGESSEQSVVNAQIALANSQLSLQNARDSAPWTSLESARINLDKAQTDLDNAQRAYDEALSRADEPNAASSVDSAYERLESARTSLASAQTSYFSAAQNFNNHSYNVAQAENNVIQNQIALANAQSGDSSSAEQIQSVNDAQLRIDQIQEQIAQSSLYAPIDGVVLEVSIQPGASVQAFDPVITIAIPEPLENIANLPFNDIQRLSVGQVGICSPLNQPEAAVQCVVRQLPLSNRDADQTVRVAATLPDVPQSQVINVEMPLQVRENVLWLPPAAIRTFQNRSFVVVQTADGEQIFDVVLGLETDDRVEIESGVEEGMVVVGP